MEYKHEEYDKFIQSIITSRGQWNIPKNEYKETHHIIPICMGGEPKGKVTGKIHPNLIWLYPEEHYIAHKLLAEENPNNKQLCSAFWYMSISNKSGIEITEQDYKEAKILWAKYMKQPKLEITKHRISEACKGKTHAVSEETRKIIGYKNSISLKGRKISPETVANMTKAHIGLVWWNNGVKETKSKECPGDGYIRGRLTPSEEAVKNRSLGKIGKGKPVKCIELNLVFNTAKEANDKLGINRSHICNCCKGYRDTAGGYHWCYYKE